MPSRLVSRDPQKDHPIHVGSSLCGFVLKRAAVNGYAVSRFCSPWTSLQIGWEQCLDALSMEVVWDDIVARKENCGTAAQNCPIKFWQAGPPQ